MSAGTQVYTMRISEGQMVKIRAVINHRNDYTLGQPWTFCDFVRKAISEKLQHMERSRKTRKVRRKADAGDTVPAGATRSD